MLVMLYYNEQFTRWDYRLLDTKKKVSELKPFVEDWIDNHTNMGGQGFPIRLIKHFSYYNPIHPRISSDLGYYNIDHNYGHHKQIAVSFYEAPIKELIDNNSDEPIKYYLVVFNHNGDRHKFLIVKTNTVMTKLLKDTAEEFYTDFKYNYTEKGRWHCNELSYVTCKVFEKAPITV